MRFIVIVAMYNMADQIRKNILSLQQQTFSDFRCFIGDDLSTDDSAETVQALIESDPRFKLIAHTEKKFSMGNIYTLIKLAAPDDDDVIVLVDGDDCLAHNRVLEKLYRIYNEKNCWITYGSYSNGSATPDGVCKPYSDFVVRFNLFRFAKWRASHLKTFKYKLWKQLKPEDFTISESEFSRAKTKALSTGKIRTWLYWKKIPYGSLVNPSKEFIRRCDDKAMTIPMLEMAGERSQFVDEIFYYYTVYQKKLNFDNNKINQKWFTRCIRYIIKQKPRYRRLPQL